MNGSLVIGLSLGSALAFALSSVLKHASAGDPEPGTGSGLLRFLRSTLSHPLWLGGIGADVVGLALQIAALHLGTLAVVQPMLTTSLLFALLLRHRREPITRSQWAAGGLTVATLIGFVLLAGSTRSASSPDGADREPAVLAAVCGLVFAVVCVAAAARRSRPSTTAALLGVVVGGIYATTAALLKSLTSIAAGNPVEVLSSWQLYALIALGAAGLVLAQLAFSAGSLTASLPAMASVDPLASVAIGVLIYDEHIRRGPGAGVGLVALLVVLGGSVIVLARGQAETPPKDVNGFTDSALSVHVPFVAGE